MQNKFFMRHKQITTINRKCKSIKRLHEVVLTMPNPNVNIFIENYHIWINAYNTNGICFYTFSENYGFLSRHEINIIKELRDHINLKSH